MKNSYILTGIFTPALYLFSAGVSLGQSTALPVPSQADGVTGASSRSNSKANIAPASATIAAINQPIDIIIPATVSMNPGDGMQFNLQLANPAPSPGILVSLASSDSTKATTNYSSVYIDGGQISPARQPSLNAIAQGSATITASANGLNSAATVVMVGSSMGLTPSPLLITGANGAMTLTLSAPAVSNFNVSLNSSNTSVAVVPVSLPITVGTNIVSFNVTAAGAGSTTITASAPGYPAATASAIVSNSFSISTSSLPNGVVGSNYNAVVTATGGAAPYSWSATGLPNGLSMASATGIISGAPTISGSSMVTIRVTDENSLTALVNLILSVNSTVALIAVSSGGTQSASAGAEFANPLAVIVKDASNNPLPGATVTFTVPASGPSATLSSYTAITNSSGLIRITATANTIVGGPYTVSATMAGAATSAKFSLTNKGLTVTMIPANLSIVSPMSSPGSLTLNIDSQTLQVDFTLTSSNPAVAAVPSKMTFPAGVLVQRLAVTAVSAGTVVITASSPGYPNVSANVTVNPDLMEGRFLEQAAFGPTPGEIAKVQSLGINGWLDSQFAMPETAIPILSKTQVGWIGVPSQTIRRITSAPDQLRQKMAWALGKIIVISMNKNPLPDMYVPYQQILSRNAFGNYRTLLSEIARSPQMGKYLDIANSNKPTEGGASGANENFPRELMQLFTIGLNQLNMDGSTKLVNGQPVETFTQTDVRQLALALTGWTYPTAPGAIPAANNSENFSAPAMETRFANHDTTQKTILGCTLPGRQSVEQDLDGVIDCLLNHPNAGPFLATRLIRSLVTSNPSPAFIQRIAAVFNNNGAGARGDLQAMLRAILTDAEARQDIAAVNSGKLKDPIYTIVSFTRMMNGYMPNDDGGLIAWSFLAMAMGPDNPPSVFGYFSPSYRLPLNSALFGPEFQIYSPAESVALANILYWNITQSKSSPVIDLSPFLAVARNTAQLVDLVDQKLCYGRMPAAMRTSLSMAIEASYDDTQRVQTALYLTALSGQYQTQF